MITWTERAEELYKQYGSKWSIIANEMMTYFPGISNRIAKERIRTYFRRKLKYKSSEKQEKKQKLEVVQNLEPAIIEILWNKCRRIRFALMGDTQMNSKYSQITYLHDFYNKCAERSLKDVYHTGDIDDGEQMRQGHQYECYTQGADDHIDEIVCKYPERNGITTHFITGNHDASFFKSCGLDIGRIISDRRPDMEYLGRDCAVINLTPNCTLELSHPWDGTAYSISYKTQKRIEAMQSDTKPNILAVGHYHKQENIFYRNVHCFQTACFQAQSPWMRGKNISCSMGGWIIEVLVDEDGHIQGITSEFIPYYKPIKDDYKNWFNKDRFGNTIQM